MVVLLENILKAGHYIDLNQLKLVWIFVCVTCMMAYNALNVMLNQAV